MSIVEESPRRAERCYLSTPQHVATTYGKYGYIYTDKGTLEADDHELRFDGKNTHLVIDYQSIVDLKKSSFNRGAKPFRLDRLDVTYHSVGGNVTAFLVPTRAGWAPTWTTNKVVADWLAWIQGHLRS